MPHPSEVGVTGMAGLRYNLTRISLAVRDARQTMAEYQRAFGWSGWKVYDYVEPFHREASLRGESVAYDLRTAEVTVGSVSFVLVESLKGPNPWSEFVDTKGEGLVSIGVSF